LIGFRSNWRGHEAVSDLACVVNPQLEYNAPPAGSLDEMLAEVRKMGLPLFSFCSYFGNDTKYGSECAYISRNVLLD